MNKHISIRSLCVAAVLGAAYAALTMLLAPISYGAIQFRVSELFCILPYFMPCTSWGLFFGCMLANTLTGNIFDIIFGSLATLIACLLTARLGKARHSLLNSFLACLMPVIFNALIVGAVITQAYMGQSIFGNPQIFALNMAQVGLGEAGVMFIIGLPLMHYLPKHKFFNEFVSKTNNF